MSTSREVLARSAAARLNKAECRERSELWNEQEQLHKDATTSAQARAAAAPLLEACGSCPIVAECTTWATVDLYTGIAAAGAWVNGKSRPVGRLRHQPPRRLAS